MNNKSFTLIELLVVIVIIGILAGVIMISTSFSINKANIAKAKVFEESVQNNLAANMVSAWDADHVSKGTTWVLNDKWGSNNGTFYDNTSTACTTSLCPQIVTDNQMENVLSFDGTNDYIDCGNDNTLDINNAITISAWINIARIDPWNILVSRIDGANGYELRFQNGKMNLAIGDGTTHLYPMSNVILNTNTWTHVVAVYSDNDDKIFYYINGSKETLSISASLQKGSSSLKIGDRPILWTHPFKGLIYNVHIYNAALSSSQIKQNYIAGLNSLLSKGSISKLKYNKNLEALSQK